jgi:hypothetical protein
MNTNIITQNSELFTSLITIVAGAIIRIIEKKRLKKKGLLIADPKQ